MDVALIIIAILDGLRPGNATCALMAEGWDSMIWALVLMAAGAVALRMAMRAKGKDDPVLRHAGRVAPLTPLPGEEDGAAGSRAAAATDARESLPRQAAGETNDARAVLTEVKQLRRVLADEADRHAERLEGLIAKAEETIRRLETLSTSDAAARSAGQDNGIQIDPLNRRIYELADQGLPPVEIARSLSQQTGKVELVLALRPR